MLPVTKLVTLSLRTVFYNPLTEEKVKEDRLMNAIRSWPDPVQAAVQAVIKAGMSIATVPRKFEAKAGEGHRSGKTAADDSSQNMILWELSLRFPQAKFLCEEDTGHPACLPAADPQGIFQQDLAFVVDGLDSTARFGSSLGGWSVAVGIIQSGIITGSALFAPASNGGFVLAAAAGQGVVTAEWDGRILGNYRYESETPAKQSIVLLGVDTLLYGNIVGAVPELAANVRAVFTSGSGLLGLAWVACGRAQAVIQTPQKAWDWAPLYCAVLEGRNMFQFFRLTSGELARVSVYDFEAFCTTKERPEVRLGFVAGEPALTEKITSFLPTHGWARMNPDITSGTW